MRLPVFLGALCAAGMASAALVEYDLVISQGNIKNDGQTKRSWLINGQSPGPAIVATKGDTVNVRVLNLGSENITIQYVLCSIGFVLLTDPRSWHGYALCIPFVTHLSVMCAASSSFLRPGEHIVSRYLCPNTALMLHRSDGVPGLTQCARVPTRSDHFTERVTGSLSDRSRRSRITSRSRKLVRRSHATHTTV